MSHTSQNMRTYKSVIEEIRHLEETRDWLRYQVNGWSVWPLFRFSVAVRLLGVVYPRAPKLTRSERLILCARDLCALARPHKIRLLAKVQSTSRAESTAQGYKDVYFDDLLVNIGSYFKIENINNAQFFKRSKEALVPSQMWDQLFRAFARLAYQTNLRIPAAHEVAITLEREFSECFGKAFMPMQEILNGIKYNHWLMKSYKFALSWLQPQLVIVQNASEFALVSAARELGIPTIEFQHGFIDGNRHPSYSWSPYAKHYRHQMCLADFLFTYGDFWVESLKQTGFWADEVYSVGSLRVDNYRRKQLDARQDDQVNVLYTSTGVDQQLVTRFLAEALSDWTSTKKPKLTIKLHPGYDPDPQPFIDGSAQCCDVDVLLGQQGPSTFELMQRADVHCSIDSTCHFESIALGTPTLVLPFTNHDKILDLVERGHAKLVSTPDDLRREIQIASTHRVPEDVGTYYYKPNALDNMLEVIEELLQSHPREYPICSSR